MVAGQAGRVSDAERIADLERELRQCDGKITELKTEHGEMLEIMRRMREHAEDHDRLLDQWIDVFQMSQDDTGTFNFDPDQSELWQRHVELWHKREALVKQWNKFVPIYNATI